MARYGGSTNVAQDNSRVENQIGVVHGDAHFYTVSEDSAPEDKFRVGLNYLNGNMPRQAEKLIAEAVMSGFGSIRAAYYWTLAILSGRSFDHLTDGEFAQLQTATSTAHDAADRGPSHEDLSWLPALDIVGALVRSTLAQEQNPDVDPVEFAAAFQRYEKLPEARRDEIRRHLEMILAGNVQDQLAAQDAAEVAERRMAGDREHRVWTFFMPNPAEPRRMPTVSPDIPLAHVLLLVAGCALISTSLYPSIEVVSAYGGPVALGAVLVLVAGAIYLGFRFVTPWLRLLETVQWNEARLRGPRQANLDEQGAGEGPPPGRGVDFPTQVARLVDLYFEHLEPVDERAADNWRRESKGIRRSLKKELVDQYTGAFPASANAVEWLVQFHAYRIFDEWKSGRLHAFRKDGKASRTTALGSAAAGVLLVTAWLILSAVVVAGSSFSSGFRLAVLVGAGLTMFVIGTGGLYLAKLRFDTATRYVETRFADEQAKFDELKRHLDNRPTDADMAAWLDYDKAHIKAVALKGYGLANRDILAHVILTEAPARCRRARYLFGPPRYSKYEVRLFLLTDAGVRQFSVRLNSETGTLSNESRSAFRYDAITSAEVMEVGVRMDGAKRKIVESDGRESAADQAEKEKNNKKSRTGSNKLTLAQSFKLTLNNQQATHVLIENFDEGLIDKVHENPEYLYELARDTSGVTAALRVLEAVAAEGRDWVHQEHARRRRRWEAYERSHRVVTPMLTPAPPHGSSAANGDGQRHAALDAAPPEPDEDNNDNGRASQRKRDLGQGR